MRSKYELRAHKELELEGWTVDYKIRPPSFTPRGYNVDFWGCFDLVARRLGEQLRWISIKGTAGSRAKNRAECQAVTLPPGSIKELWHIDGKGNWKKEVVE